VLLLGACERPGDRTVLEGVTMGTNYSVVISGAPLPDKEALHQAVQERLDEINHTMSTYDEDSELSRINRSRDTGWIQVSDNLFQVLSKSIEISHLTGGTFDITVGPLVNLWGFGPDGGAGKVPDAEIIHATLQNTGYSKIKLSMTPPSIRKTRPDLYLDLSAIAKGFAVDEIASLLDARGLKDYMVDIGGEVRTAGKNPEGKTWRIGIEKPLAYGRSVQQVVTLGGMGMATSGDYRNYFEQDGVRYSHTLDPRTGYPIRHNLASVSVLHDSTMTADALATALLVMGPTEALAFASRNYLPAFFIINTGDGFIEQSTESFNSHLVEKQSRE
jgi:thiamine biosynthesis lipoprotein